MVKGTVRGTGGTSIILAVVLFAALSVVLSLLFMLRDRLRAETDRLPEKVAAGLRPDMLRPADESPRFDQIEDFARRVREDFPGLESLYVTKFRPDNVECCIYPWTFDRLPPANLQSIKIEQAGFVLGYLYLGLDTGREQFLQGLIDVLIPLLILAAFVSAAHVWRQERALASTRFQLEERNQELARFERLSLAGQLAANLLHDLKKPVLHIRDELRQAREAIDPETLNEQVDLFLQMLRETNLEKLAGGGEEREEYLDVEEVLRVSLNLVKYERGQVEVHFESAPGLPFVRGYKYRLVQVFSNLLLNAYQALRGKGHLWVRAFRQAEGLSERIGVEIRDDGPGISPEHLPRIFEPFYSASGRTDASGLGLYITRTIIEEMGGSLEVDSSAQAGTTIRVWLPVEPGPPA